MTRCESGRSLDKFGMTREECHSELVEESRASPIRHHHCVPEHLAPLSRACRRFAHSRVVFDDPVFEWDQEKTGLYLAAVPPIYGPPSTVLNTTHDIVSIARVPACVRRRANDVARALKNAREYAYRLPFQRRGRGRGPGM